MDGLGGTVLRVALVALGLLMAPLVASRVVEGWNWPPKAFALTYVLFFGTGMAYALIARKMGAWAYKTGVGLALATGFAMGWGTMVRTSESENPANLLYFGVLVVGAVGAWLVRLDARGLARTMFVMAALLAVMGITLPRFSPGAVPGAEGIPLLVLALFVGLFATAGLLFRYASRQRPS
ncbi:MAG: hypothetical protein MUF01_08900 [Bryobacterales bacterium]|jgi:hypothetical protein|nr:hypothetical protein [Bryobacterales bacterium]